MRFANPTVALWALSVFSALCEHRLGLMISKVFSNPVNSVIFCDILCLFGVVCLTAMEANSLSFWTSSWASPAFYFPVHTDFIRFFAVILVEWTHISYCDNISSWEIILCNVDALFLNAVSGEIANTVENVSGMIIILNSPHPGMLWKLSPTLLLRWELPLV